MGTTDNAAPESGSSGRAYLLLTMTSLCWGANTIFGKLAAGEVSPMALVSLRWFGALMLLLVFAHSHLRRDWAVLKCHAVFISIMGALGFATFNGMFYTAAHTTTALNIGIIQGSIPIFVLSGAYLAYRTRITKLQFGGVLLTMLGVLTVVSGGNLMHLAALSFNFGDLLMIGACALYAGYTVGLRRRPAVSSLSLFTGLAAAAFVTSLPMAATEIALGQFQWPTVTGWVVVVLVTLFPSFLAQIFFIQGVQLIGPGRAGIFVNLVPVFASTFAVVYLGEAFEVYHAAALGLVLFGIWLSERGKAD